MCDFQKGAGRSCRDPKVTHSRYRHHSCAYNTNGMTLDLVLATCRRAAVHLGIISVAKLPPVSGHSARHVVLRTVNIIRLLLLPYTLVFDASSITIIL